MSVLGIDFGQKKIGLAISDDQEKIALPLTIVQNWNEADLFNMLSDLCREKDVSQIVIGTPLAMDGSTTPTAGTKAVEEFAAKIKQHLAVSVSLFDERLTTSAANSLTDTSLKGKDDAIAAMLILQSFLDQAK